MRKSIASLRDLKRAAARRGSKSMAIVLNKISNDADACFRSRPSGLSGITPLFVVPFRQSDACLQRGAAIGLLPESQRYHRLTNRFPSWK
jgi:hypothetical protein